MRIIEKVNNQGHGACSPSYLFIHETANPGASAFNHSELYGRGWKFAVQYVCDWTGDVYHCVPDNRLAYGVGNGNRYGVNLEICHATNAADFKKVWDTAIEFTAWYLKTRGWSINNLMSHDECRIKWGGTDHTDPVDYFKKYGKTFQDFKNEVKAKMDTKAGPKQVPGNPVNNAGLYYRAHVQGLGWLDSVHDGQTAGTTGYGLRTEAFKISPPAGLEIEAVVHMESIGWKHYPGIKKGENSGTGSSTNDPIIGSTGKSLRMEDIILNVTKNTTGKKLQYRAHRAGIGWTQWVNAGEAVGSIGMKNRIEAIQMKLV